MEILSLATESVMLLGHINYYLNNLRREKTAHLVSRLACNTRLIVDASSYPPVFPYQDCCNENLVSNHRVNKQKN